MKKTVYDIIFYLAVFMALMIVLSRITDTIAPLFGVKGDHPVALIVSSGLTNLIVIVLFLWRRWGHVGRNFLKDRPMASLGWTLGAAAGVIIPAVWLQEQLPDLPDITSDIILKMVHTPGGYFILAITTPLAEEIVFRGAILRRLLDTTTYHWVAIIVSAILFDLIHINPTQMPQAFLVGIILGWIYYRAGSTIPCIVFHWLNNTIAYFFILILPDPQMKLTDLYGGNNQSLLLSILFSLCIFIPSIIQLNARLKRH